MLASATRRVAACAVTTVLLAPVAETAAAPQSANPRAVVLAQFEERVTKYLEMRNDAVGKLEKPSPTPSPVEVTNRQRTAAKLVRTARPAARQGEIFFPEVVPLIKEAIGNDFSRRSPAQRKAALAEVPEALTLQVNEEYPSSIPLATVPPRLLQQLPRLPEGLEYRFVARRLILLDTVPNLVVDFIEDAVPRQ